MPSAVFGIPARLDPPRKPWTRFEYDALSSSGLLEPQHLELIEGELIDKGGNKRAHVNAVTLLGIWLTSVFGARRVNAEAPIDVGPEDNPSNEPEPDLIVLNRDTAEFADANPRPADLALVLEVGDSTLGFDLTVKAALYARARVAEYWVLNVAERRMIVHRDPKGGMYSSVVAWDSDELVSPLAAPGSSLRIGDVFGPE